MEKKNSITTTDLADFGFMELEEVEKLIRAWKEQGLPDDFYNEDVHIMFNKNSGSVFLTNSEFQVATMNGDDLESWYYCGNCGHEGFKEDCQLNDDGCECCNPQNDLEENGE